MACICDALGCSPDAEGTVVLVDDAQIRALNHEWRGIDAPTDVLSFAYQEAEDASATPDLLGDIIISVETAERLVASGTHRDRLGWQPEDWNLLSELVFLISHGALHLVGYDHATADEERVMRAKEREVFGVLRGFNT